MHSRINKEGREYLSQETVEYAEHLADTIEVMRLEGIRIYPPQNAIFRALDLTHPNDVKVCMIGQDPYHTPGVANGLAFSVSKGQKLPPSLRNIFKELHEDIGCVTPQDGDLTAWAKQGVLLLNTSLTVEEGKPNSHQDIGWEMLTREIFDTCLKRLPQPIVFVLWGKYAQSFAAHVSWDTYNNKGAIISPHPSPFSANKGFFHSRPFSRANAYLQAHGSSPIEWDLTAEPPEDI